MNQIKGLFIDIDGVLIEDNQAIPGAVDKLNLLRQEYKVRLLTNTTTKTADDIYQLLTRLGFILEKYEIITAPIAAKTYLKNKGITRVFPVVNDLLISEFKAFTLDENKPEAIVIGDIGEKWNYALLNQLFKCLIDGAELIALHKSKFWKSEGALQLDIGMFVDGLEYATGKSATVIGKPSHSFFDAALQSIGLPKNEVLMIGDDIHGDIQGAQQFGIQAYLVQTGKYNESFVQASRIEPDGVIPSIERLFEVKYKG